MNQRHTEFFGPDLARGPFASSRVDVAALQIATALAQLRAPVSRDDDSLLSHGDFVRQLADRIAPDHAAYLAIGVSPEVSNTIQVTFHTAINGHSLLECWLADDIGGGVTGGAPSSVTVTTGTLLTTLTANKHLRVMTNDVGIATLDVSYAGSNTWFCAVSRYARVFYSDALYFS